MTSGSASSDGRVQASSAIEIYEVILLRTLRFLTIFILDRYVQNQL